MKAIPRQSILALVAAAFCWTIPVATIHAQESRGTILGRVVDASGAVMPGVDVKAINTATTVTVSAQTNEAGSFNIPFLLPGTYRITAEISGFKRFIQEGVQVRVSETVELN